MNKTFNIVAVGVGGQGIITLTRVLATAAMLEGFDVKTSELHGLSQRGGSVETHIRFGESVYSPLVKQGGADLIISLEFQEAFKACYYGSRENGTVILVNNHVIPILGGKKTISIEQNPSELRKFSNKVIFFPATKVVEKEIGNPVLAGTLLLSVAVFKRLIPLKPDSLLNAIKEVIPGKYLQINKKAFKLGAKSSSI